MKIPWYFSIGSKETYKRAPPRKKMFPRFSSKDFYLYFKMYILASQHFFTFLNKIATECRRRRRDIRDRNPWQPVALF